MNQSPSMRWLISVVRKPGFWLIAVLLSVLTILHYRETIGFPIPLTDLMANINLDRHAIERIAYLAPIIWAGFLFGWKGALGTSLVALACMLPRAIFISDHPIDAIFETSVVFVIGNVLAFTFGFLHREREHRARLDMLNSISGVVSQSLELEQLLYDSIDKIKELLEIDIALVFLLNARNGELTLTAYRGVSYKFVRNLGVLKLGEGLNGLVAQTGKPMLVHDTFEDPRLTKIAVRDENIHSQLIVPLKSKGNVMGTLAVLMRSYREFDQGEVELLGTICSQIGVAIENARLYEQERKTSEQLRESEERYRELFESAHDAIWVHDMAGNFTSANAASARVTGYDVEELLHMNVLSFLSEQGLHLAKEIRTKLLNSEYIEQPYEQSITTKQGNIAVLMLSSNVLRVDGKPVGFQHIARDVSQEKQMQESLRFYLGQITRAQEEERKRIARELHDETIQELVVLSRHLDNLASNDEKRSAHDISSLEKLHEQTNNIIQGIRRLSQDLRPAALDRLGLLPALEQLASNVTEYSGIVIKVNASGNKRRFSEEVELVLFRVAQEAVRNIWRHSQATSAEIIVEFGDAKTVITVKDNGKGFNPPETTADLLKRGRLGLAGMYERIQLVNGRLEIESKPGNGTKVTIEAPV